MNKIELNKEELENILKMYNEQLLGTHTISVKMGISKPTINRILKENGVVFGSSGRRNIGGKKVADKKWREKNKEKVSVYVQTWNDKKNIVKNILKNTEKKILIKFVKLNVIMKEIVKQMTPPISLSLISELPYIRY
jgi:hypothetical protein